MEDDPHDRLPWLKDLMERVRGQLACLEAQEPDRQRQLAAEAAELNSNMQGWALSLANPNLQAEVRAMIEQSFASALSRKNELDRAQSELACRQAQADEVLDPKEVVQRVERLADILASNNLTRGNVELSLHIDRIDCDQGGAVTMRTCKLGALTGAADLVVPPATKSEDESQQPAGASTKETGPRRRTRLRVTDVDATRSQSQALADFAADPYRFADLSDDWFWIDRFQIPTKTSWVEDNAAEVLRRYEELERQAGKKPSLNVLAAEFGKSRPTITAALKIAREGPGNGRRRKAGEMHNPGVDARGMADDMARMYREENLEIKEIAERTGAHRNTVARTLDEWYEARGLKRDDGRNRRKELGGERKSA